MGELIKHGLECPLSGCNSSDGAAYWLDEDGVHRGKCFSCGGKINPNTVMTAFGAGEGTKEDTISTEDFSQIESLPTGHLRSRKIHEKVASEYGVRVEYNPENGEEVKYYFPVYRDGKAVAHKVRDLTKPKKDKYHFTWKGSPSGADFFGSEVGPRYGKAIIITAGFEDAIAADQMIWKVKGKRYKCRSVLNGVQSAVEEFKKRLEYLSQFETVFICFDQDDHEQTYAKKCADLLPIGSAKIMRFSEHDANDMLKKGKHEEFVKALADAEQIRPDGIISGLDTWDLVINKPEVTCFDYPWKELNEKTYGWRVGELVTFTSGSGSGKTQLIKELIYHQLKSTDFNIGVMALEEPVVDTVESLMGLELGKRIHLPDVRKNTQEDDLRMAWENTLGTGRIHLLDHFGSTDSETLFNKIRYMAKGLDCKVVILDHLSIVVSEYANEGDERKNIDSIMSKLKQLTQELNIWIGLIVHLRKSDKKPFELGEVPSLDDLRSSGAIKQLSNSVIAVARNQQAEDERVRNTMSIHSLKNRFNGVTGPAGYLYFDQQTGRLIETEEPEVEEASNEKEF